MANSSGVLCIMVANAWYQACEVAVHITSAEKQKAVLAHGSTYFPIFIHPSTSIQGMVMPRVEMLLGVGGEEVLPI